MPIRSQQLARLEGGHFDLLVIGGGIVGAGIARDAAMRGLKVALVDKGDFAAGASSKTSKLIHGGLRYLEHGHLKLVKESLRERKTLRSIAPDHVTPQKIHLPVYAENKHPAWMVRTGLWLYSFLAGEARIGTHRFLSAKAALYQAAHLSAGGLKGVGVYYDCSMDDARLCLMNVLQAQNFDAVCLNYAKVTGFLQAEGKVCGAAVEDALSARQLTVRATAVVNASGPWGDSVRRLADPDAGTRLAPTKGAHVLLPAFLDHGIFFEAKSDQRMLFMLPWKGQTLLGTTESPSAGGLDGMRATEDEIQYLLDAANRCLQERCFKTGDVIASFAGARPLLGFSGNAHSATREHQIEELDNGLVSIMGGKYTTYRVMAAQTVDRVMRRFGLRGGLCVTDSVPLIEGDSALLTEQWRSAAQKIGESALQRIVVTYGMGAARILQRIQEQPESAERISPHHEHIRAELWYMAEWEMACTLEDLLVRRTHAAWRPGHGQAYLDEAERVLRRAYHYDNAEMERQKAVLDGAA